MRLTPARRAAPKGLQHMPFNRAGRTASLITRTLDTQPLAAIVSTVSLSTLQLFSLELIHIHQRLKGSICTGFRIKCRDKNNRKWPFCSVTERECVCMREVFSYISQ